jgi:hypothetical protein
MQKYATGRVLVRFAPLAADSAVKVSSFGLESRRVHVSSTTGTRVMHIADGKSVEDKIAELNKLPSGCRRRRLLPPPPLPCPAQLPHICSSMSALVL